MEIQGNGRTQVCERFYSSSQATAQQFDAKLKVLRRACSSCNEAVLVVLSKS